MPGPERNDLDDFLAEEGILDETTVKAEANVAAELAKRRRRTEEARDLARIERKHSRGA